MLNKNYLAASKYNRNNYFKNHANITTEKSQTERKNIAVEILAEAMAKKESFNKTVEPQPIQTKKSNISNIRKTVATLANKLNQKLKNLSAAFKKAWKVVKAGVIKSKVSGVTFGNTQKALSRLTKYNPQEIRTELVRESNNQHDNNAISIKVSVNNSKPYKLGFLPKDLAQYLSKLIDKGIALTAQFKGVTGGTTEYECYGALIEINF